MEAGSNLTNHFLIAMPALNDPHFFHTVTYICEHTEQGSMGIIINRPIEMKLSDILQHMEIGISKDISFNQDIYKGGPVEEDRGFVVHEYTKDWDSTLKITDQIAVTTSRDVLEAIAQGEGPKNTFIALGYAGWAEGQLEKEMAQNAWLSCPADKQILFDLPTEERWKAAAKSIGVDVDLLSTTVGHA